MRRRSRFTLIGVALAFAGLAHAGPPDGTQQESGILPVDEAFRVRPAMWNAGTLSLALDIAPGCYLYRSKLLVEAIEPSGYALGPALVSPGEPYRDAHFGEVRVLRRLAAVSFVPASAIKPTRLRVRYQGCAQDKVCYPVQTREIEVLSLTDSPE